MPAARMSPSPSFRLTLFTQQGATHIERTELDVSRLGEHQLLWVHGIDPAAEETEAIGRQLCLPDDAMRALMQPRATPQVRHHQEHFSVEAVAVKDEAMPQFPGETFMAVCGANLVVTVVPDGVSFLDDMTHGAERNPDVGALTAESFLASMLDAHLTSYFDAASHIEAEVEQLETRLMADKPSDCLERLRVLRRAISRLRRMLATHRRLYSALARPDFRPHQGNSVNEHFARLEGQYERAMDVVEHGRELVLGSFDLFSTRLTMTTNDMMQILTFVTVLFGFLAVAAGVLGMNFEAPFFKTGAIGFWTALSSMGVLSVVGLWWARRKRWM